MEYVIVYLIRGKIGKYHKDLVRTVGPKFGEDHMINNPIPSHVTLKAPFQFDDLKKLEKTVRLFAHRNTSFPIDIEGFDNFRRFVAFLKTKFSKKGVKLQKELLKELKSIEIEPHEFDVRWKPHATVSYGNTKKSFDNIWDHLMELDEPRFKITFDNITILKKPRKYWKVHRAYRLKG